MTSNTLLGLDPLELGRLRMSVGYGTHRKGRPLSPIEVATLISKARAKGVSLTNCAKALQLNGTGHIGRFVRLLALPRDLRHLIDWGSGTDFIGFSAAVELASLRDEDDQHAMARAIMANALKSKEVRQVIQLRKRSGRTISACVREVVGMRPIVEKRYVLIGAVAPGSSEALAMLTQSARNRILAVAVEKLGIRNAKGRLGLKVFTLVGDEAFNAEMGRLGGERIEETIRTHVSEAVVDVRSRG